MFECINMTAIGFISGSIMYSCFIPKYLGNVNIVKVSKDGNPGSMNAMASVGKTIGFICLILDVLKAFAPVFIAVYLLNVSGYYLIPVIIAPVLGHAFSPLLMFKGGKAVAATYGVLLGAFTISGAVFIFVAVMAIFEFIIVIKPNSTKVMTAYVIATAIVLFCDPLIEIKIAVFLLALIGCYKHYKNPNKEHLSISLGNYITCYADNKIQFIKR